MDLGWPFNPGDALNDALLGIVWTLVAIVILLVGLWSALVGRPLPRLIGVIMAAASGFYLFYYVG